MDVRLIPYKVKQRLNKKDSSDYQNLECHQIVEAYNKTQLEVVRSQAHGNNLHNEASEQSTTAVDDLQILLRPVEIKGYNRDYYFLSNLIPKDYLKYNVLRVWGSKKNCINQKIKSDLREEANSEELLRDKNTRPNFSWRSTFHTLIGNRIKIYTNGDFTVSKVELTYYRKPVEIRIVGCDYLGESSPENIDPELNDALVELIIDKTASLLAGDMENPNQLVITAQRADKSN